MENNRMEQLEALEIMSGFNDKLLRNLPILAGELDGFKRNDTDTYLQSMLDVINWITSVIGATLDVLNEGRERFDKAAFNSALTNINEAAAAGDDTKTAESLRKIIPCFEALKTAIKEVV
ncbi:MAG: molecular chaperone [Lachnospiraceae bacterium]|nr:molecular chaperone [Lachnospiraceae bacterium]